MAAAATAATSWPSVTADDGKSTAAASSGATGVHKPVASSTMWSRALPQAVVDCALPSAWQPDPVVPDYVEDLFLLRASASNSKAFMSADRLQAVLRVNDVDAESGKWTAAEGGSQQGSATLCKRVRGDTQYALGVAADGSTIKLMRRRTHSKERAREDDVVAPTPPPHTLFSGFALQALGGGDAAGAAQVDVDEAASGSADNILGDNAVFVVTDAAGSSPRDLMVRIPVAAPTRANFAFYGAVLVPGLQLTPELLAQGDVDSWGALTPQDVPKTQREALALYKPSSCEGDETPEDAWFTLQGEGGVMPVFGMDVGSEYFVEYLQRDEPGRHGSGVYIENHTTPHLHIPANKDAGGYIILGKRVEQATPAGAPQRYTFMVSAFQIPFGKALAMRPLVWHCDAGVTGAWTVGYTAAPRFTTWLLRQQGSKAGGGGSQQLQRAPVRFVTNNN